MSRECSAARVLTHSVQQEQSPPEDATSSTQDLRVSHAPGLHASQAPASQPTQDDAQFDSVGGKTARADRPRAVVGDAISTDLLTRLHAALRDRIGPQRYAVWFDGICRFAVEDGHVTVISDGQFAQDLVRRGFRTDIEAVAENLCSDRTPVRFRLAERTDLKSLREGCTEQEDRSASQGYDADNRCDSGAVESSADVLVADPRADADFGGEQAVDETLPLHRAVPGPGQRGLSGPSAVPTRQRSARQQSRRRPLAQLDEFVTGGSNRMARAAAEMVVSRLGEISPLVIHGPSGTGKTHLLEGIVSLVRERHPGVSAMLVPAEQFTTTFLQALHGTGLPGFRRSYRSLDLLLVDDLQFFSGKRATAVELQQTFDALRRQGRQVICTCDREPETLTDLGPDLLGRLEGGMSVRISPAEYEVRRGIVASLADRRGLDCEPAVLDYVATHLTRNARELTGGVNRLEATSHMLGLPVTIDLAEEALADLVRAGGRGVRLADIEKAVCAAFGLEAGSLQSPRRSRAVNHPRMLAMFLARKHTPAALAEIGSYFGRRSHSTVIAARKTVAGWLSTRSRVQLADAAWDAEDAVRRVEELLRAGS